MANELSRLLLKARRFKDFESLKCNLTWLAQYLRLELNCCTLRGYHNLLVILEIWWDCSLPGVEGHHQEEVWARCMQRG